MTSHTRNFRVSSILAGMLLLCMAAGASAEPQVKWEEIEKTLEDLRAARKTDPLAKHDLANWYDRLADPAFSKAQDLAEHCNNLSAWRTAHPDSATPLVVMGKAQLNYAWEARGTGFANTVSKESFELFQERVTKARTLLEQATKLGVKDGEAYRLLVTIAKAEGLDRKQADAWLDAGQKLDPTYLFMYVAMAEYLLPRWHGDPGDLEVFATDVVRRVPGDDGLEAFALIAMTIDRYDRLEANTLFWGGYDPALLVKAAEVLVKRFPQSRQHVQFAALLTLAAQDQAAARRIQPLMGEFVEEDGIWAISSDHKDFHTWCNAQAIPDGEETWIWGPRSACMGIGFASNARFIWSAQQFGRTAVELLDLETKRVRLSIPNPGGYLSGFAVDNKKKWIVVSYGRGPLTGWILWDAEDLDNPIVHPTAGPCLAVAIHPSHSQIAWGEGTALKTLDTVTEVESVTSLPSAAINLTYSPDGTKLAIRSSAIMVCDPVGQKVLYSLARGRPTASSVSTSQYVGFDATGRLLVTAKFGERAELKDVLVRFEPDGVKWEILIDDLGSTRAWLAPDGETLAVVGPLKNGAEPSGIDIWDLNSRKKVKHLNGHWRSIGKLAFSEDGRKLASIANMGDIIKVWSLSE